MKCGSKVWRFGGKNARIADTEIRVSTILDTESKSKNIDPSDFVFEIADLDTVAGLPNRP